MRIIIFLGGFALGFLAGAYIRRKKENDEEATIYDFPTHMVNPDAGEHPQDSDEDEIEVEFDSEGYQMSMDYEEHKNDEPRLMSAFEVGNLPPSVSTSLMWYFTDNCVLVDAEDDSVIENEKYFLGDCLDTLAQNDTIDTIFVMNYSLNTLYEVGKRHGEYSV